MTTNNRSIIKKRSFILLLAALVFVACKQRPQPVSENKNKVYYTCSMHPQIHEEHPGDCPICHMLLIKKEIISGNGQAVKNRITLTAFQIKLARIETDTVRLRSIGSGKTLTGTVTADQNHTEQLSARVAGRIQRLYIRSIGEFINAGQPVYDIYSEDLLEAETEYLLALQQKKELTNADVDYNKLINAAENKLLLWGISPAQIKHLAQVHKASATITVFSKTSGTVTEINIHEGDYITEGLPILKTDNLNSVWVEAQLYANEAPAYHQDSKADVSFPDLGGKIISGKIAFANPELSTTSKVSLIRINIHNIDGMIRPGMLAYVSMVSGNKKALAIPASAVLTNGKGTIVWIKNSDGSFSMRNVNVGNGNSTAVPVLSGISAGDVVVTNGVYLLNSEYIFKNGDDKAGMEGMKM